MHKAKIIIIFAFFLSLYSCFELLSDAAENISNNSEIPDSISEKNFKVVTINNLYQLSVPKYMKELTNLHPEATLKYGNLYKEAYTAVLHEDKQEIIDGLTEFDVYDEELSVIENYRDVQKNLLSESINNIRFEDYGLSQINGYDARQIKVFGDIDDLSFFYIMAFVEGPEHIYMIMNWTLPDKQEKLENTYEYIIGTFKTVKNR